MAFKLLELHKMAAYLNQVEEAFGDLGLEELKVKMHFDLSLATSEVKATVPRAASSKDFILCPVSASARLKRNCSERPLNSRKQARVVCDLDLKDLTLELSDSQYQCAISGARALHQLHKNRSFWQWRPRVKIKGIGSP